MIRHAHQLSVGGMRLRWQAPCVALAILLALNTHCIAADDQKQEITTPRVANAYPVDHPPEIDGKLDEEAWQQLNAVSEAALRDWCRIDDHQEPSYDHRVAYLLYDDTHLYVAMIVRFGDVEPQHTSASTVEEDHLRVDFDHTALGITWDNEQLPILLPYLIPIRSAVQQTDDGWIAEMAIPWAHVHGKPGSEDTRRFNLAGSDLSGSISWARVAHYRDVEKYAHLKLVTSEATSPSGCP